MGRIPNARSRARIWAVAMQQSQPLLTIASKRSNNKARGDPRRTPPSPTTAAPLFCSLQHSSVRPFAARQASRADLLLKLSLRVDPRLPEWARPPVDVAHALPRQEGCARQPCLHARSTAAAPQSFSKGKGPCTQAQLVGRGGQWPDLDLVICHAKLFVGQLPCKFLAREGQRCVYLPEEAKKGIVQVARGR